MNNFLRSRKPAKTSNEASRIYYEKNPEKLRAHYEVKYAVRIGRLTKQPCAVCGASDVHAHHEDYSRPFDVVWLCPLHHIARHAEMRRTSEPASSESAA